MYAIPSIFDILSVGFKYAKYVQHKYDVFENTTRKK